MTMDPTQRFSSRVENYLRYRPRYPQALIATLEKECGLTRSSLIADIGSGTGLLTELFLRHGNQVMAVEPNREMRQAAERLLMNSPGFCSIAGRAEGTTLPDQSVDFVVAGQAFHWFAPPPARAEFMRILKAEGWVVLIWNKRENDATPFLAAYEQLLRRYAIDYLQVDHTRRDESILEHFFGAPGFRLQCFCQKQELDWAGVRGRLLSSSYAPEEGHPNHEPMLRELERMFRTYETDGSVIFAYTTQMYFGHLSP